MALIIQKFGGTSVGTIENIQAVAKKVLQTRAQGHDVIVVVSAMNGETDRLINLAKTIQAHPDAREYAALVTTGEQVSSALVAMALIAQGQSAKSFTGAQAHIQTDHHHKKARIVAIHDHELRQTLAAGQIPVVAGFQGISTEGDITTLGRGGSDTTAVALAAALKADECQIYTDVDGVYTADPRIVPQAHRLPEIAFTEMLEFAHLGAKVLQQRAVEFASKCQVPLRVLSSFKEGSGTLIHFTEKTATHKGVTGIAFSRQEARLSISALPQHSNAIPQIITTLRHAHIDVDMLTSQIIAPDSMELTFTLARDDYSRAIEILSKHITTCQPQNLIGNTEIAKLSLVGLGLRSHPAIITTLFETLGSEGILAQLVSTSEIRTSVVIDEKDVERGMRALHTAFGLDSATN